jgi:hypothetical protein
MTREEEELLDKAATKHADKKKIPEWNRHGRSVSAWARRILLEAAKKGGRP